MFDNSYVFEPTVTLNGILILPYGCQASGGKPPKCSGRQKYRLRSPTWQKMLGVKK